MQPSRLQAKPDQINSFPLDEWEYGTSDIMPLMTAEEEPRNLVEVVDTALFELAQNHPLGTIEHTELVIGSMRLREQVRKWKSSYDIEKTARALKSEPYTYRRDDTIRTNRQILLFGAPHTLFRKATGELTEEFLKRFGVLEQDETLEMLERSNRWREVPYGGGTIPEEYQLYGGGAGYTLPSNTPGLEVGCFINGRIKFATYVGMYQPLPDYKTAYQVNIFFERDFIRQIVESEPGESLFQEEIRSLLTSQPIEV